MVDDLAQEILSKALDDLEAAGMPPDLALHSLVKMAVDTLPGICCRGCLPGHYEAIIQAVETAIDEIPDMVPGRDIAIGPCDRH